MDYGSLFNQGIYTLTNNVNAFAGTTDDAFFDTLKTGVPAIAERAWAISQGA